MVFLHGTVADFAAYIPVDNAVTKLKTWHAQGAAIVYLSSHRNAEDVEKDKAVLKNYDFPVGEVYARLSGETYQAIAENVLPDVLIEDDCESIGGEAQMVYPHIRPELKSRIKSIVVREFGGIDHLPDALTELI